MRQGQTPSVFLIGAMKAGTTSIAALLGQQPGIFLSPVKEPNYFKSRSKMLPFTGPVKDVAQWANADWTLQDYEALFIHAGDGQLSLDATTGYLVNPETPSMIREYCPDAKIIVVLRDPVERAYSAYNFMSSGAGDPCATFDSAIASELRGERDTWLFNWRYLYGGRYNMHLQRWLAEFPRERILVLDFEQFVQSPATTIQKICAFLNVAFDPARITGERENATTIPGPLNRLVRKILINPGTWKGLLKPLTPHRIRHALKSRALKTLRNAGAPPTKMADETRARLEEYYLPHIREAEHLLANAFGLLDSENPATKWLTRNKYTQQND